MKLLVFLCFVGATVAGPLNNVGPSKLVSGGTPAARGQFPFYAYLSIQQSNTKSKNKHCGASILNELFLLTAAQFRGRRSHPRHLLDLLRLLQRHRPPGSAEPARPRHQDQRGVSVPEPRPKEEQDRRCRPRPREPTEFSKDVGPIAITRNWQNFTQEGQLGTLVGLGNTRFRFHPKFSATLTSKL